MRLMQQIIIALLLLTTLWASAQQSDHPSNPLTTPANQETIAKIKAGVAQAAIQTKTIFSDFTQVKNLSMLNDELRSFGKFYFKKEQNLRWEYTHPFSYIIVLQEDKVSIREDKRTNSFQTSNNPVFQEINRIIIGSVRGTLLDDPDFAVLYEETRDCYQISLQPKQSYLKKILERIILYFNPKTFMVDKLQMVESGGDQTTITFSNKHINKPINDALFSLQ